jgi:hypothetical protein
MLIKADTYLYSKNSSDSYHKRHGINPITLFFPEVTLIIYDLESAGGIVVV